MALNIRNAETERLARRLAELTGATQTEVVRRALEDRLQRMQRECTGMRLDDEPEHRAFNGAIA